MPRAAQKPVSLGKLAKPLPIAMSRAASPAPPPRPAKGSAARAQNLAGPISQAAAMSSASSPGPIPQASPDGSITSVTQNPMNPTSGATDGLGAGVGGLAIHPSAKGANIDGYEPRHSSKRR